MTNNMRRWSKRILTASIVIVLAWWLFSDTYARHFPASADCSEIRFAHFGGSSDYQLWKSAIADFHRLHPTYRVRQEYVVGFSRFYNTKLRQQIVSGTLPEVALIQLGPFHELADHFADAAEITDTSPLVTSGVTAFTHGDIQRGLPISGGNLLIYCNPDCFAKASQHVGFEIPLPEDDWTIDDFHRTAKLLTCDFDNDGQLDQFGYWHTRWIYFLPFAWSLGAEITTQDCSEWLLFGNRAEHAISLYRDLAVGPERVCPAPGEIPQVYQDVGFLTGKVGMCINGPWFQPFLAKTKLADRYIVAHIPYSPDAPNCRATRITWDGIIVRPDLPPQRNEVANEFVRFLLSRSVQDRIAELGRALPARLESTTAFSGDPADYRRQMFVDALPYSRTQPLFAEFSQVDRTINRHLRELLQEPENADISTLLQSMAEEIRSTKPFSAAEQDQP